MIFGFPINLVGWLCLQKPMAGKARKTKKEGKPIWKTFFCLVCGFEFTETTTMWCFQPYSFGNSFK